MHVKRSGRKIFGARMSAAEKKAMEMEIRKELAEYNRKNIMEIDAIVLWILHEKFEFGHGRLRKFYDEFIASVYEMTDRYEMEDEGNIWICTQKLKDYGIDLEQWHNEGE